MSLSRRMQLHGYTPPNVNRLAQWAWASAQPHPQIQKPNQLQHWGALRPVDVNQHTSRGIICSGTLKNILYNSKKLPDGKNSAGFKRNLLCDFKRNSGARCKSWENSRGCGEGKGPGADIHIIGSLLHTWNPGIKPQSRPSLTGLF